MPTASVHAALNDYSSNTAYAANTTPTHDQLNEGVVLAGAGCAAGMSARPVTGSSLSILSWIVDTDDVVVMDCAMGEQVGATPTVPLCVNLPGYSGLVWSRSSRRSPRLVPYLPTALLFHPCQTGIRHR